jgi:transcription antitermination factor NusG
MSYHWYVIRTKPRTEDFLAEQMEIRRLEIYNPRIRVQTVNPRARKVKPYFPGYIFAHLDLEKTGTFSMQYIPGSTGLVSFGGEAAEVPAGLIKAIRQRVDEINSAGGELFDAVRIGETVMIHSGPLAGYEAIFDARLPGTDRVRVLLKLLKSRQLPVDLPAGHIHPMK